MNLLKDGSTGTNVRILQMALKRANYYNYEPDGIFGEKTKSAVTAFQQSNGLVADGIVGNNTWSKISEYIKGYKTHRIRNGDTLWGLSQQYKTDLKKIITANPTVNPNSIKIGSVIIIPLNFNVVPTNVPYTSELLSLVCEGLAVRYPFLSLFSIGKTVMNKNIPLFTIGRGKTEVFYNAAHHANEWITTPVLLKFLEEYSYQFSIGGSVYNTAAAELYNKATLYIAPMVDLDGVDLVNGVVYNQKYLSNAEKIAEEYPDIIYPSGWKANIVGTDLNLQYPANWDKAKTVKYEMGFTSPAPRDFVGYAPLNQPESRTIYNYTKSRNFSLTLSYHSQGKLVYWKYLDYEPENSRKIAEYFGKVSGYSVEETPYVSGFAGYKDWFIQEYNKPGYTIEVGKGKSPLPLSQFDEIYSDNIGILTGGITQI